MPTDYSPLDTRRCGRLTCRIGVPCWCWCALQMSQFKFDDVGRRQVALEERFVLQRGIIHPYNTV